MNAASVITVTLIYSQVRSYFKGFEKKRENSLLSPTLKPFVNKFRALKQYNNLHSQELNRFANEKKQL